MGLVIERALSSHLSLKNNKDTGRNAYDEVRLHGADTRYGDHYGGALGGASELNRGWPLVAKLAHEIDEPGSLILVANDAGEVIIRAL